MTIALIADHEAKALARLIEQYKGKPKISSVVSAYGGDQTQELEGILHAMLLNRALDNAAGQQLDNVGEIVGVARTPGDDDDAYRLAIRARIAQNGGFGTPEEIIAAIMFLTESTTVNLEELFPAAVQATIDGVVLNADAPAIVAAIQSLLPAGVRLAHIESADDDNAFIFLPGVGGGFGDYFDDNVGGRFAAILGGLSEAGEDDMPSKHVTIAFTAETTKDINVGAFTPPLNAQKCSVQILDVLSAPDQYQTQELDVTRPNVSTIRLTAGSPITKTFRLIIVQAGD